LHISDAKIAKKYLRALCRIYFIDFACTNYELPTDCIDILNDIEIIEAII